MTLATITNGKITGANLSNVDMTKVRANTGHVLWLRNYDLTGTNFTNATLTGVSFAHSNLTNANFTGANLISSTSSKSNLQGANFTNANLTSSLIASEATSMNQVILTGATIKKMYLGSVDMRYIYGYNGILNNFTNFDFTSATLTNANLTNANLTNANMTSATLTGATWTTGVTCANPSIGGCF